MLQDDIAGVERGGAEDVCDTKSRHCGEPATSSSSSAAREALSAQCSHGNKFEHANDVADEEEDVCLICLGSIQDMSVLPTCLHSLFCFQCILQWISLHRRCPLCSADVGDYLIHNIQSDDDYVRHQLPQRDAALKGKARDTSNLAHDTDAIQARAQLIQREAARTRAHRERAAHGWSRDWREKKAEHWNEQLARRRRIYRQSLFCMHVGSNRATKLVPPPTPEAVASTPVLQATLLHFVRRDLLAFPRPNIDIDFVVNYILILLKEVDIKSDAAVNLLSDFLGREGAEHFCHELYTFLRFVGRGGAGGPGGSTGILRDRILAFDQWAQYQWPEEHLTRQAMDRRRKRRIAEKDSVQSKPVRSREGDPLINVEAAQVPFEADAAPSRHEIIARRARWLHDLESRQRETAAVLTSSIASSHGRDGTDTRAGGSGNSLNKERERLTLLAKERIEALHDRQRLRPT